MRNPFLDDIVNKFAFTFLFQIIFQLEFF